MDDTYLGKNAVNFVPLTPAGFIERSAMVYRERLTLVHGARRRNRRVAYSRCWQPALALAAAGVRKRDTVAAMLPNTPAMVEVHFGVPMTQAAHNALNTRLDPEALAFMLDLGEAKVVLVDRDFSVVMRASGRVQTAGLVLFAELPKTSTGKIRKFELRPRAEASGPAR